MLGSIVYCFAQLGVNQTYYYEQIARVSKDGSKTATSGDGHYITKNNIQIYESDANGCSLRYGVLKYTNSNNGLPTYEGDSYLGRNLTYRFNADFSRLNIVLNDGTYLIYTRLNTPDNSNMRKYSTTSPKSGYVEYNPSNNEIINNVTNPGKKERNPNNDYYEYKCGHCNGTGRRVIERQKNMSNFGIGRVERVKCNECGKVYDKNGMSHTHQICDKCNGKGKIRERL